MLFLAQVNCAELPVIEDRPEILRSGTLFFFYDVVFDAGTSDPVYNGPPSARVIHVDRDVSGYPARVPPRMGRMHYFHIPEEDHLYHPEDLDEDGALRLERKPMTPVQYDALPSHVAYGEPLALYTRGRYAGRSSELDETERARLTTLTDPPENSPISKSALHALFGCKARNEKNRDPDWIALLYLCAYPANKAHTGNWANFGTNDIGLCFDIRRDDAINRDFSDILVSKD